MTTYLNGNSRLLVEHHSNTYILQHPCGGEHNSWQDSLVASSPEEFLKLYLDRNIKRISAQPKKMANNVRTVLSALCG